MKAALRVAWLLFDAFGIQRWLNALGLVLLLAAYAVPRGVAPACVFLGLIFVLFTPGFVGGVVLRSISTPRTLRLVPYGRLQVLLGMAFSVLAMSGVVTFIVWSLDLERLLQFSMGLLFLRVAAIGTFTLLGMFVCCRTVPRTTLWMMTVAFGPVLFFRLLHFELWSSRLFAGPPLATLTVVAWLAFAVWYLRARVILPPDDGSGLQSVRITEIRASRRTAIRTLLIGHPYTGGVVLGGFLVAAMLCGVWLLVLALTPSGDTMPTLLAKSIAPGLGLGGVAGIGGFMVSRRSKLLWLKGGLARTELFRLCEAEAWRYFGATIAPMFVLLGIGWALAPSSGLFLTLLLLFHAAVGSCVLYLGLMHVTGWRLPDVLMGIVIGAAWITGMALAQAASRTPVLVPIAIAIMVVLAALLRMAGLSRWRQIDWLICKPPRAASRSLWAAG